MEQRHAAIELLLRAALQETGKFTSPSCSGFRAVATGSSRTRRRKRRTSAPAMKGLHCAWDHGCLSMAGSRPRVRCRKDGKSLPPNRAGQPLRMQGNSPAHAGRYVMESLRPLACGDLDRLLAAGRRRGASRRSPARSTARARCASPRRRCRRRRSPRPRAASSPCRRRRGGTTPTSRRDQLRSLNVCCRERRVTERVGHRPPEPPR